MRSISGPMRNAADQIRYRGNPIGALRADQVAERGSTLVPEGRHLFPSLSVQKNLLIGVQLGRTGPWLLEAVFELFPILEERRPMPSTALSGGQQQMVATGRALMANPDLPLFDEISLGLAPISANLFALSQRGWYGLPVAFRRWRGQVAWRRTGSFC